MVRVRQKKINPKSNLPILREADTANFDPDDVERGIDAYTGLPKIESGVESKEEKEHHLQAVISAAHAAAGDNKAKISIPTPEAVQSNIQYDRLFPVQFAQPATYIRFSSTVEDCVGVVYCMSDDDEQALKAINAKYGAKKGRSCSEAWFEQLMSAFEETSALRQPFAAVDHPLVLSLDEMQVAFDETVEDVAKYFAKDVYEYWKDRLANSGDHRLMAQLKTLKMDSGQDNDDSDPYVCFRRREHRQARKTRGRDAQVAEKLKKLRRELEEGRYLLDQVKQREIGRRDDLKVSQRLFEQRAKLRQVKRECNILDDDTELLITQKRKRPTDIQQQIRPSISSIRLPSRADTFAAPDTDRIIFADELARREREISRQINSSVAAHDKWNQNYIEETLAAVHGLLTPEDMFLPPEARSNGSDFVSAKFEVTQQPTPPASVAAESASEEDAAGGAEELETKVRWAQPSEQKSMQGQPRYRRRMGRGGRMMIDRHNLRSRDGEIAESRFAFDHDSGDEEEQIKMDLSSTEALNLRVAWSSREAAMTQAQAVQAAQRRASIASRDVPMINGQSTA